MQEFKTQTYREMEYHEFDKLVATHLNMPDYEVVADEEWDNDTDHTTTVRLDQYTEYDKQSVRRWLDGTTKRAPQWGILLCELAARGIVPEGNYLVNVCW